MAETNTGSKDRAGQSHMGDPRNLQGMRNRLADEASATAGKAKEAIAEAGESAKGMASALAEKVGDAASATMDKTKQLASTAAQKVDDFAEDAVGSVGDGMKSLGGRIRRNLPNEGVVGSAASGVASSLESGGSYLQEQKLSGMARDVKELIRSHPFEALLAGVGLAFLAGLACRRS